MLIARQPIFKKNMDLYGYELLFRKNENDKKFGDVSAVHATAHVLQSLYEEGSEKIVGKGKAFVNFEEITLNLEIIELLDPKNIVIEVLENIFVDSRVVERVKKLKEKGYMIALDDYDQDCTVDPFFEHADIVKIDVLDYDEKKLKNDVRQFKDRGKILLAEKVETQEMFEHMNELDFDLFQGFFFSKPQIISKRKYETANKTRYLQILNELHEEEPSYQKLAELFEHDAVLSYKLMRIIAPRVETNDVYSIKRALTYMGLKEIEKWVTVAFIQDVSKDKPFELMYLSLLRASFAENLIREMKHFDKRYEAFMTGLFSVIDVMLDTTFENALEGLKIPDSVKDALVNQEGELGKVLSLMFRFEHADYKTISGLVSELGLPELRVSYLYIEAMRFASNVTSLIKMK